MVYADVVYMKDVFEYRNYRESILGLYHTLAYLLFGSKRMVICRCRSGSVLV